MKSFILMSFSLHLHDNLHEYKNQELWFGETMFPSTVGQKSLTSHLISTSHPIPNPTIPPELFSPNYRE